VMRKVYSDWRRLRQEILKIQTSLALIIVFFIYRTIQLWIWFHVVCIAAGQIRCSCSPGFVFGPSLWPQPNTNSVGF
jgi:hypothetical protein